MFTHDRLQAKKTSIPVKSILARKCDSCREKGTLLQRAAVSSTLKTAEPKSGHDFSRIKIYNVPKLVRANPKTPAICDSLLRTECDIEVHPDDEVRYNARNNFRVVGRGLPIIIYPRSYANRDTCIHEVSETHENVHVRQMQEPCQEFKQCVDERRGIDLYNRSEGGLSSYIYDRIFPASREYISREDYDSCREQYGRIQRQRCIDWEREAYELSIERARQLLGEIGCRSERANLEEQIRNDERIKDNAPNCNRPSNG